MHIVLHIQSFIQCLEQLPTQAMTEQSQKLEKWGGIICGSILT